MGKIFKKCIIFISIFSVCSYASPARAEIDPRIKALLLMAGYGTIGGALLGTASLAFGASGRSVAKGASLGLYAGIVFGSYVVISHYVQKQRRLNPAPVDPYYENLNKDQDAQEESGGLFGVVPNWNEYEQLERDSLSAQNKFGFLNQQGRLGQSFYVPVVNFQF